MKKLFFIMVCIAAVALAGCKDSPYSDAPFPPRLVMR